jgi:hypothetical protein
MSSHLLSTSLVSTLKPHTESSRRYEMTAMHDRILVACNLGKHFLCRTA